ncbi:MAG: hypothetical protein ACYDCC_11475 [Actinomycetota bacterium]
MFNKPGWQTSMSLGFIALGFIVIGVAWNGAAGKDCASCQLPYLLSGGFAGLGMIVVGVGLMLFESGRRAGTKVDHDLKELNELLGKMQISSNGHGPDHAMTASFSNGKVVIGSRSYHRPDCRLVQGKEALVFAGHDLAVEQGLQPCRVCNPD